MLSIYAMRSPNGDGVLTSWSLPPPQMTSDTLFVNDLGLVAAAAAEAAERKAVADAGADIKVVGT